MYINVYLVYNIFVIKNTILFLHKKIILFYMWTNFERAPKNVFIQKQVIPLQKYTHTHIFKIKIKKIQSRARPSCGCFWQQKYISYIWKYCASKFGSSTDTHTYTHWEITLFLLINREKKYFIFLLVEYKYLKIKKEE